MTTENIYLPMKGTVREANELSKDVKSFSIDLPEGLDYRPGQFVMVSVFGAGEAPISITSTPGLTKGLELCVRTVGRVTAAINRLQTGDSIWVRGPYGKPFPMDTGTRDVLFVCGGIGIVPIRPLINLMMADPKRRRRVSIIYGCRNPFEVLLMKEIESWSERGAQVVLTVDSCDDRWKGCTGVVTEHLGKAKADFKDCTAYICGPHVMIQAAMRDLSFMGMPDERIITTLEAHMKCGVGKCGHCYCGGKLICEDGPVFSLAEIKKYNLRPGVDGLGQ
jgi:NAD(P)H-flavin reductase